MAETVVAHVFRSPLLTVQPKGEAIQRSSHGSATFHRVILGSNMSADKNKKVRLAHLAREKGIQFYLDPSPEDWPELYSKTFSEVCKIETVKFGTYRDEARHEPEKTP